MQIDFLAAFWLVEKKLELYSAGSRPRQSFCTPGDRTGERGWIHVQILRLKEGFERAFLIARSITSDGHELVRRGESHHRDQSRSGWLPYRRAEGRVGKRARRKI